jgi:hypothetical protein
VDAFNPLGGGLSRPRSNERVAVDRRLYQGTTAADEERSADRRGVARYTPECETAKHIVVVDELGCDEIIFAAICILIKDCAANNP